MFAGALEILISILTNPQYYGQVTFSILKGVNHFQITVLLMNTL